MRLFSKHEPLGDVHYKTEIVGNTATTESYQFAGGKRRTLLIYTIEFPMDHLESLIENLYENKYEEVITYESWRQSKAAAVS